MTARDTLTISHTERAVQRIEWLISFVVLFLLTRVLFVNLFTVSTASITDKIATVDPRLRMLTSLAYLLVLGLVIVHHREMLRVISREWLLLGFVLWIVLSLTWSTDPGLTFRRLVSFLASTVFAIFLASQYTIRKQARLFLTFLAVVSVLSLFLGLAFPDLARYIEPRGEVWSGVFVHKNGLGRSMALNLVMLVYLPDILPMVISVFNAGIALVLLVLAQSRTAEVALVLVVTAYPLLHLFRRVHVLVRWLLFSVGLSIGVLFGLWVVRHYVDILLWMGRDPSLTGRTLIWGLAWHAIRRRLWLGYGYEAFWSGQGETFAIIWRFFTGEWMPMHAHNGILEIWLGAGLVGVLLWAGIYGVSLFRAVTHRDDAWPLAFLLMYGLYTIAEPTIAVPSGAGLLFWIIFVATAVRLRIERAPRGGAHV